jgi:Raf kinase inhibitor-like YbhB/YbcL family protein
MNVNKRYICKSHGGDNIPFKIFLNMFRDAKSYAVILEDPDSVNGNFIHWYVPIITIGSKDTKIIKEGYNSLGEIGYHGPCAPEKSGVHRYIFTQYALDGVIALDKKNIRIKSSKQFENILKKQNIKILEKERKIYKYEYTIYK